MEFIWRLYIAVLRASQCKKGHKIIINRKLTYWELYSIHIVKRKENKNKYDETKCHIRF